MDTQPQSPSIPKLASKNKNPQMVTAETVKTPSARVLSTPVHSPFGAPPFPTTVLALFLSISLILAQGGCLASAEFVADTVTWGQRGWARWFLPEASSESRVLLDSPKSQSSGLLGFGVGRFQDYLKTGLVLLLLLLFGLSLRIRRGRSTTTTSAGSTSIPWRRVCFPLYIMALFTSLSVLLFAVYWPAGISGLDGGQRASILSPPEWAFKPEYPPSPVDEGEAVAAPVFTVPASADLGRNLLPNIQDPHAVDAQVICPGYKASNVVVDDKGFTADLLLAGPACNVYGNDVGHLALYVEFQADDRVHVEIKPRYITAENYTWFQLPETLIPRPPSDPHCSHASSQFDVSWSNDPTFSFTVQRKETGDTLFTTEGSKLVYEDQFIEFVSPLPENYNLYGLGEVIHGFRLGNNLTRTLFAADVGNNIDYNIYGTHPIYLDTRYFTKSESGQLTYVPYATDKTAKYTSYTHGVYQRNAHAQEVILKPSGITWRALGGSIDLYFYSGPKPEDIIKSYQHSAVGLPAMQQYWTLGFHQCRWGYNNWTQLQEVLDGFEKFQIPLETIWTDIDYMKAYRDFEMDPVRFSLSEGADLLARLHAKKQHYVPIVDSAIYVPNPDDPADAYPTYERGLAADAFVKNPDGSIYIGAVWPGYTVFPDWVGSVLNGSGTINWWIDEMYRWSKEVAFDGIWIDMSEVASFCVGSCGTGNLTLNPAHPPFELPGEPGNLVLKYPEGFELTNATEAASASSALYTQDHPATQTTIGAGLPTTTPPVYRSTPTPGARNVEYPPYVINNYHGDIGVHALSPDATHRGGYLEYDFHNLFGHQILNATYQALLKVFEGKRPFIIGRSTFAGSGKWAGHWGGDNESLWAFMFFSIPQALSFSIFGIPMFGVDTCGFNGNADYELCSRWMQLSAFFPFYRNHNAIGAISQEPYVWGSVVDASKKAMSIRYSLLPYMYTLMTKASLEGSTVMRALAWEFPEEPWLADADRQFLLGGALMVTPCLVQGADSVDGVFPGIAKGEKEGEVWYDWYTHKDVTSNGQVKPAQNVTIEAPLGHIPVYLRGGYVLPIQEPGMTTAESRQNCWGLIAALDKGGNAKGELYLDDGESLEPERKTWVRFTATSNSLAVVPEGNYPDTNALRNATILGVHREPSRVALNGAQLDKTTYWTYEGGDKSVLRFHDLNDKFMRGAWTVGWNLTWE